MTVAIRNEPEPNAAVELHAGQDQTIVRLVEWAQAADAAYQMASKLANTSFIPAKYRGKPAEMAAAMLAGAELGVDPMASLRAFHDIQGTPTPSAVTLRAVVQSRGHEIRVERSDDDVAVVSGRRKGSEDWQTSTWTFKRANDAGFPKKNPNWNTQRAAMLVARATSEVCRWVGSDAIMGMPYSAEEMADQGLSGEPRVGARRLTAVDLDGDPQWADPEAEQVQPEEPFEPMSREQQGKLFALFAEKGVDTPTKQRTLIAETIGREVKSRGELSKREAGLVIDELELMPTLEGAADDGVALPSDVAA